MPRAALIFFLSIAPLVAGEFRTFHNAAGDDIQAKITGAAEDGQIHILTSEGKPYTVDPALFSADDQAYITEWLKARSPSAAPPAGTAESDHAFLAELTAPWFDGEPEAVTARDGTHQLVYQGETGTLTAKLDGPGGRVTGLEVTGAILPNDDLRQLRSLTALESLHFGHWGNWKDKSLPAEAFDGSALEAFADAPLRSFQAGGSMFNDAGFVHIAKIQTLEHLTLHHVSVAEENLKLLEGHPALTSIELSSMGKPLYKDSTIPLLAKIPNLRRIAIHESYLTFDGGFAHLEPIKDQIERIFFRYPAITPEDRAKLEAFLPNAEVVVHSAKSFDQGHVRNFRTWVPAEDLAKIEAAL